MKHRDTIISWNVDKFNSDITIYRADKAEANILKNNIGKIVNVKVHNPKTPKAVSIFPIKVNKDLGYDGTHESMIPDDQKNWSKKQKKLVPNRFIFKVEPHTDPSPWAKYV